MSRSPAFGLAESGESLCLGLRPVCLRELGGSFLGFFFFDGWKRWQIGQSYRAWTAMHAQRVLIAEGAGVGGAAVSGL